MLPRLTGLVFGSAESSDDFDEYEELPLDEDDVRPDDESSVAGAFLRPRPLLTEFATEIKLFLKVRKVGQPNRQYFVAGYWRKADMKAWVQFVTTDMQTMVARSAENPDEEITFTAPAKVGWYPSEMRYLRFEVYKVKDSQRQHDFHKQKFVGCVNTSLIEVLLERAKLKTTGWKKMDLEHPIKNKGQQGIIGIFAEEDRFSKEVCSMELSAKSVKSSDMWKARADPYLVVYREGVKSKKQVRVEALMRTQVARKTGSPSFGRVYINLAVLYGRSESCGHGLMVEMRDWFRVSRHNSIGEAWLNIRDLRQAFNNNSNYDLQLFARPSRGIHVPQIECKLKATEKAKVEYNKAGVLTAQRVHFERQFTLFDHLRGGLEIKLAVAIDFSRSCQKMETRKELGGENPIIMAIRACGDIMNKFDSDDQYPVYGLGAALPPNYNNSIDMFALTGDIFQPEVNGIEGICRAYRSACRIVRMHGPTHMSEAVDHAGRAAQPFANVEDPKSELCFSVMLILTDAGISDAGRDKFIESVVSIAHLPLHIVLLGVGCKAEDARWMRSAPRLVREARRFEGASEEELAMRDVVRFVEMSSLKNSTMEDMARRVQEDAALALKMIPREVLGFYTSKGVKPRGLKKFENDGGEALPPPSDMYSKEEKKALKLLRKGSRSTSRDGGTTPNSRQLSRSISRMSYAASSKASSRRSRSKSGLSDDDDAESTIQVPEEEEEQHNAWRGFLAARKDEFRNRAKKLGFHRADVERVLREGLASEDPETMSDMLACLNSTQRVNCFKNMLVDMHGAELGARDDDDDDNCFSNLAELRSIIKGARSLLRCDRLSIYVYSPGDDMLRLYAETFDPVLVPTSTGLAAHAFRSNETINIKDCYDDFRFDRSVDIQTGYTTRSMSIVPVIRDGFKKPVGVVQAINKFSPLAAKFDPATSGGEVHAFTDNDLRLLQVLAIELGYALADGYLSVDQTLGKMSEMSMVNRQLVVDVDAIPTQVLKSFTAELAVLLHCDKVSVFLHDAKTEELVLHSFNLPGERTHRLAVNGIVGFVFINSQPIICEDAHFDSRFDPTKDKQMNYRTKSMLAFNIADEETESVGVIQAINKLKPDIQPDHPDKLKHIVPFSAKDEDIVKLASNRLTPFIAQGSLTTEDCKVILAELKAAKTFGKKTFAQSKTKDKLKALKDEQQAAIDRIMQARDHRPDEEALLNPRKMRPDSPGGKLRRSLSSSATLGSHGLPSLQTGRRRSNDSVVFPGED